MLCIVYLRYHEIPVPGERGEFLFPALPKLLAIILGVGWGEVGSGGWTDTGRDNWFFFYYKGGEAGSKNEGGNGYSGGGSASGKDGGGNGGDGECSYSYKGGRGSRFSVESLQNSFRHYKLVAAQVQSFPCYHEKASY